MPCFQEVFFWPRWICPQRPRPCPTLNRGTCFSAMTLVHVPLDTALWTLIQTVIPGSNSAAWWIFSGFWFLKAQVDIHWGRQTWPSLPFKTLNQSFLSWTQAIVWLQRWKKVKDAGKTENNNKSDNRLEWDWFETQERSILPLVCRFDSWPPAIDGAFYMAVTADMALPAAGEAALEHHRGRLISLHSVIVLRATHRGFPSNTHT